MPGVARKILIVDDDPWVGKLVEFVARDFDFEPLMARDGAEALEMFGEQLPDLAVLDVVLPKIDGLEVCRRLKTSGTGAFTPVVIVSGIYRAEQEAFSKFRADAYFGKPITPEVFGKRISALFPPVAAIHADAALPPAASDETAFTALPLAMALARGFRLKRTGVLHVRTRGIHAELRLREGRLVSVKSEAWNEPIAEVLVRLQRISLEKRAQLELQASSAGASFGDTAVKEGAILGRGARQGHREPADAAGRGGDAVGRGLPSVRGDRRPSHERRPGDAEPRALGVCAGARCRRTRWTRRCRSTRA